jgi:hypothetical protein
MRARTSVSRARGGWTKRQQLGLSLQKLAFTVSMCLLRRQCAFHSLQAVKPLVSPATDSSALRFSFYEI